MKLVRFEIHLSAQRADTSAESRKLVLLIPSDTTNSRELLRVIEEAAETAISKHIEEKTTGQPTRK
jgi:hypothetical protein